MTRPFELVDVFGETPFGGNPLAVVHAAEGLSDAAMLRITQWLNLSETTFLLPPEDPAADYRVRIFTLDRELPFAGHPTLGSAHAWRRAGGVPRQAGRIVQQCGAGLVAIEQAGDVLAFAAPPLLRGGPVDPVLLETVAQVLRIDRARIVDAAWADNGPGWIGVLLESAEEVLALEPLRAFSERIEIGVVGPHRAAATPTFELRAIFSDQHRALIEDPVTGSLNASIGQWLFATGRAQGSYRAIQGTRLGRQGRIAVRQDEAGQVWVGGTARTLFTGVMAEGIGG